MPDVDSRLRQELIGKHTSDPKVKPAVSYAASWANLLSSFNDSLHLFEYKGGDGQDLLLFCDTEYIPGDVAAAPSTGNIECIMTVAALAGCDVIQKIDEKTLPIARGPNMQLIFREHPQLGDTATFLRFPGPATFYEYVS